MPRNATAISARVRKRIHERDQYCRYCGRSTNLQIAHYVSRGRGGKGCEENLILLCSTCHWQMDNGNNYEEMRRIKHFCAAYLQSIYPEWNEKDLVYSKWR